MGERKKREVKGRDRNKIDPDRPNTKLKKNDTTPPDSGYRSRSLHLDKFGPLERCPDPGLNFVFFKGSMFLRGTAGFGVGVQFNLEKELSPNLNLTEGWSFSVSGAKDVWGRTIDFGGGANFVCTYLKE